MNDHTDAEFARREHDYEMGGESASDRAWTRFYKEVSDFIILRGWGRSGDGDQEKDGFSLDYAYEAWEDGKTAVEYISEVVATRREMGL
jgi:hypothetical protein